MISLSNNLQLQWRKTAIKQLDCLPLVVQEKFIKKLEAFCAGKNVSLDVKKIQGIDACYRLKIDNYRCVFFLYQSKKIILVILIAHRKEVYRLLENLKKTIIMG